MRVTFFGPLGRKIDHAAVYRPPRRKGVYTVAGVDYYHSRHLLA
jgi:hypothetical protein